MAKSPSLSTSSTSATPRSVTFGRLVGEIDSFVCEVRFSGWQDTVAGECEVRMELRRTKLADKLHQDVELSENAYE